MKLYFIHIFCNKMNYEHILFKMKKFELFRHDATISKFEPDTVNLHFNLSIFIDNDEYIITDNRIIYIIIKNIILHNHFN